MTSEQSGVGSRQSKRSEQTFANYAQDNSRVGAQFSVVNGNVHIYEIRKDQPDEKYRVALNCLNGNMPRRAEELIGAAVESGFTGDPQAGITVNHVAYHWLLAVLSGRSFDHLGSDQFTSMVQATGMAVPDSCDDWSKPLEVVGDLINCLIRQDESGDSDREEFERAIAAYQGLKLERRDEIRRHLDMILAGAFQDQFDEMYAEEVRAQRKVGDRDKRVWKFFQPVPEPPRLTAPKETRVTAAQWVTAVTAAILAGTGFILCLLTISSKNSALAVLVGLVMAVAGWAAQHFEAAVLAARGRLADWEWQQNGIVPTTRYAINERAEFKPTASNRDHDEDEDDAKKAKARHKAFRLLARLYVHYRFLKEAPERASERRRWESDMARIRERMANEVVDLYDEPRTEPGAVNWLIKWRVKEFAQQWKNGTLNDHRTQLRLPSGTYIGAALSFIFLGLGVLVTLFNTFPANVGTGLLGIVLLALGCWIPFTSRLDVYVVSRHRLDEDRAVFDRRLQEEECAYQNWVNVLSDRPTDAEMARWLDYDKMYIKTLAMNHYGLANRDIVAHAVLSEARWDSQRARVLYGPPRHSMYVIVLFLLTEAGVRQFIADLNFETGTVGNLRRLTFRYDSIANARVAEVGVRIDGDRRQIILLDNNNQNDQDKKPIDIDSLILSRGFRLSFTSGESFFVVVENFDDGLIDRMREDPDSLLELALDTSGLNGALKVLEAVAAEGREWIIQERLRRERRVLDFQRRLGPRGILRQAPMDSRRAITRPAKGDETLIDIDGESQAPNGSDLGPHH